MARTSRIVNMGSAATVGMVMDRLSLSLIKSDISKLMER